MFTSNQDLFYFVLSICVSVFTVLMAIFLIYLIVLLHKTNKAVSAVQEKIQKFHRIFETGFGHLGLIFEALMSIIPSLINKKTKKSR